MAEDEGNDQTTEQQSNSSAVANKNSKTQQTKNIMSKFNKSKTGNRTLVRALANILKACGGGILGFIVTVGLIMFLLTMPGMVMEKIKGLFKSISKAWGAFWGEDTSTQFNNVEIYNVLNYLDEMGYDLKGYGFITKYLNTTEDTTSKADINGYDKGGAEGDPVPEEERKLTADGVIRNGDDDVVTGVSDFINTYLISENYIYTIKNSNTVTEHWWEALGDHIKSLVTDDLSNKRGMLVFYHDDGTIGGSTDENAYDSFEKGYIKFDTDSRKLLIKKGWTNNAMSYSLDGWTGRYGMPVDFLLTVHLATQMPDLAYDMATTFDTEINILLHHTEGTVYGSYKLDSGEYITYEKLDKAFGGNGKTASDYLSRLLE